MQVAVHGLLAELPARLERHVTGADLRGVQARHVPTELERMVEHFKLAMIWRTGWAAVAGAKVRGANTWPTWKTEP